MHSYSGNTEINDMHLGLIRLIEFHCHLPNLDASCADQQKAKNLRNWSTTIARTQTRLMLTLEMLEQESWFSLIYEVQEEGCDLYCLLGAEFEY